MTLSELLGLRGFDPEAVVVLRHRPHERGLRKVLPWLAEEKPDVFNAYQQTQGEKLERTLTNLVGTGFVVSLIGHEPGKATFVGLYAIRGFRPMSRDEYWRHSAHLEMGTFGMRGWSEADPRSSILWFDLHLEDFYSSWKGKLILTWPPPERSWWRRAHRNDFAVDAILEESLFASAMPKWHQLKLTWSELQVLPTRWRSALSQWRGIYYIFDTGDAKGYVGSAYGETNILGRWLNYAAQGHGGNTQLRRRDPNRFLFTILQRVSPDLEADAVIALEGTWKERLHTRAPFGLNDN